MGLLYFWRGDNYRRDLDFGAGFHLNQKNRRLHDVDLGDSLWAFTRTPEKRYVLAAELIISAKTENPAAYRYGRYRVWGDLRRSRYFLTDGQPDITTLIRTLSIRAGGDALGNAFQGLAAVRRISESDHRLLAAYATGIPPEPRARLLPEERLEALILLQDEEAVEALIREERCGLAAERKAYLYTEAVQRNRRWVEELRDQYDGRCQICDWAPKHLYSIELCEAHHVHWLSRGGRDDLSNMVLLCPNHHRAIHAHDAPFDFAETAFHFSGRSEALSVLKHSLAP